MNEPLIKQICNENGWPLLAIDENWPVAKRLFMEVIDQMPEARFADAEILQAFHMAGVNTNDIEAPLINAVRFLLSKGQA